MNNPIIRRELVGLLRTPAALAAQAAVPIALGALVVLRWPTAGQVALGGNQARQVLWWFGYGLLAAMILLVPVFPATSIVREKQQRTLVLLLNSPLSAGSILIGKLLGSLGFVLLLVVLSLPAAAACFDMGGVDLGQLLSVYGILVLVALQYATIALYLSTRAGTIDSALRLTYGAVLVAALLPLGPQQFLRGLLGQGGAVLGWVACLSPLPAMMEVMGHGGLGAMGVSGGGGAAGRYAVLALLSIALFSSLTLRRLNQRLFDESHDAGRITDEQSGAVRAYRRIMYLWFFDPQRRSGAIGRFTNPVMVKETRCATFGRGHWMMRLIGGCLVVSLGLMIATARTSVGRGVETLGGIMIVLQMAMIVLLTPSLASGLISAERESGGWQLLQMTPLSPLTIILGKLMSAGRVLMLVLLATLPGYAVMLVIDRDQASRAVQVLVTLMLTAVFALLLSAAISSLFRRTAAATAAAYLLLVGLCAGTMLIWVARDAPFTHSTVQRVLTLNPLAAALSAMHAPGFEEYRLLPANWWALGSLSVASLAVLLFQTWRLRRPR